MYSVREREWERESLSPICEIIEEAVCYSETLTMDDEELCLQIWYVYGNAIDRSVDKIKHVAEAYKGKENSYYSKV